MELGNKHAIMRYTYSKKWSGDFKESKDVEGEVGEELQKRKPTEPLSLHTW